MPLNFVVFAYFSAESGWVFADYVTCHDGNGRMWNKWLYRWVELETPDCRFDANDMAAWSYALNALDNGACICMGHFADGSVRSWVMCVVDSQPVVAIWRRGQLLDFTAGVFVNANTGSTWVSLVPSVYNLYGKSYWLSEILFPQPAISEWVPIVSGWEDFDGPYPAKSNPFVLQSMGGMTEMAAPPTERIFKGGINKYVSPPAPIEIVGGLLERASAVANTTTEALQSTAITEHMGVPFITGVVE